MFFTNPETDPRTSPIWQDDTHMPYANRSVSSIFFAVFVLCAFGLSVYWYLGSDKTANTKPPITSEEIEASLPPLESSTPQSASLQPAPKKNFFETLISSFFGDDEPTGVIDAAIGNNGGTQTSDANAIIEQQIEKIKSVDDGYKNSIHDVVGRSVLDKDGNKVGEVHDIIVDKKTGVAKAVVVNKDGTYESDLSALVFDEILTQSPKGDVNSAISTPQITGKKEFVYKDLNKEKYLSLRLLHDGQVLDDKGAVAGQINSIIYENAEAQSIYFVLKSTLTPSDKTRLYKLAFKDIKIIKNPDGYDVQLTKTQTEEFAKYLYGDEETTTPITTTAAPSAAVTQQNKEK